MCAAAGLPVMIVGGARVACTGLIARFFATRQRRVEGMVHATQRAPVCVTACTVIPARHARAGLIFTAMTVVCFVRLCPHVVGVCVVV